MELGAGETEFSSLVQFVTHQAFLMDGKNQITATGALRAHKSERRLLPLGDVSKPVYVLYVFTLMDFLAHNKTILSVLA